MEITKTEIRKTIRDLRSGISPQSRRKANDAIIKRLLGIPAVLQAKTLSVYVSYPHEVDTHDLIKELLRRGKTVVFPEEQIVTQTVDVFIVPGIAFDRSCNRLGWGKGYYDRLLAGSPVPKIGLAYALQVLAEVPHTSYDVPMTMIVTEKEVIQ